MIYRTYFRSCWARLLAVYLSTAVVTLAHADSTDTKSTTTAATEEQPEENKDWIELGFGGVTVDGDRAQFEQEHGVPGNQVFGGIEDLHYEQAIGSDVQLSLDGRARFDTDDYKLRINLSKEQVGYID